MSNVVYTIVNAAGGSLIGKVRLQKIAYVLDLAGLSAPMHHRYYHFGPYSDEVSRQASEAVAGGVVNLEEIPTEWGGAYTKYSAAVIDEVESDIVQIVKVASEVDSVVLELAATAAFLKFEHKDDVWAETARRKPLKSTPERIERAKHLWSRLCNLPMPNKLPAIS
ncbi:hypothetical protein O3U67_07935 [Brevundimonas diminuta]|uniref:hypothetical protein n=1 Tax=Brevundimonas diminuta TaxID=293 RepID=UPI0022AF7635|nr:hypothetical protein [Brevundimonas diminuta]MCZ4108006.1 hypothetical protein [Brevundimonas diminuta]